MSKLPLTTHSDSGSSSRRREISVNYTGSGHANRLCFERNRCILVRRTPMNYILFGSSVPILSFGNSW